MRIRWTTILAGVMAGVLLTAGSAAAGDRSDTSGDNGDRDRNKTFTFAVIGDIPYGDAQIAKFPGRIDQINADRQVQLVDHLGDIKSGSSLCSDEYFAAIRTQFNRFTDPLVYTPGDNEWTDCHRTNNGAYNPLERLAKVRQLFFPNPGHTLGRHAIDVTAQTAEGYPENVSYERAQVAFAAVHIVGSNNSLAPWTGLGNTAATPEQTVEVLGRTAADIGLIRDTFSLAKTHRDRAVVLLTQADMFDATVAAPAFADNFAFQPIVQAIAQEATAFNGPVYLFNGDSHVFNQDNPLAAGSKWLTFYGLSTAVPNLTRIAIEGSTDLDEWVKVTVNKQNPAVLSIDRVPFT